MLRLQRGGAYTSDITSLRRDVRANGTAAALALVTVSHPLAAHTVDLSINLAYEPNGAMPPIAGSLYVVAFGNPAPAGTWHFAVGGVGLPLPGALIPGGLAGSYASLGYPLGLPNLTDANLAAAVDAAATYAGAGPVAPAVLDALARLIIVSSEALRFQEVMTGVDDILGQPAPAQYAPPVATIHNWGGHTLGP